MLIPSHIRRADSQLPKSLFQAKKRPGQPLVAACHVGQPKRRLFFIADRISGQRFLIDTGAEISVLPPSAIGRRHK